MANSICATSTKMLSTSEETKNFGEPDVSLSLCYPGENYSEVY